MDGKIGHYERCRRILTKGLHEYRCPAVAMIDVTLLRAVGWLARTDHPPRPHKVGPELPTPAARAVGATHSA